MYNRQKGLLYVLQRLGTCSRLRFTKIMFLLSQDKFLCSSVKWYSFFPYKFGPYSFELFHDLEMFAEKNMVSMGEKNIVFKQNQNSLSSNIRHRIDIHFDELEDENQQTIIKDIYRRFPDYTIFSKIEKKKPYVRDRTGIITVGYEGRSIDKFLHILIREKVETLIDVRNNPWSFKYGYMKKELKSLCKQVGIEYISMKNLGIPREVRGNLDTPEDYKRVFKWYKNSLKNRSKELREIIEISKKGRVALMCFEEDPNLCHRKVLGTKLVDYGGEVEIT